MQIGVQIIKVISIFFLIVSFKENKLCSVYGFTCVDLIRIYKEITFIMIKKSLLDKISSEYSQRFRLSIVYYAAKRQQLQWLRLNKQYKTKPQNI